MGERAVIIRDIVVQKKAHLDALGSPSDAVVHNTEWLYMLEEDTRQSSAVGAARRAPAATDADF